MQLTNYAHSVFYEYESCKVNFESHSLYGCGFLVVLFETYMKQNSHLSAIYELCMGFSLYEHESDTPFNLIFYLCLVYDFMMALFEIYK